MTGNFLFWLGFLGLVLGMSLGISLLSEGSPFIRKLMFGLAIGMLIFIFILRLGVERPPRPGNTAILADWPQIFSFVMGSIAGLIVAICAEGNIRAALLAGGIAGLVIYLMGAYLPPGSIGPRGAEDIATAIDIGVTMLAGGLTYHVLRNWGKGGKEWD